MFGLDVPVSVAQSLAAMLLCASVAVTALGVVRQRQRSAREPRSPRGRRRSTPGEVLLVSIGLLLLVAFFVVVAAGHAFPR